MHDTTHTTHLQSNVGRGDLPLVAGLADVVELIEASTSTVYVRFSLGPDVDCRLGHSRDSDSGVAMPGLSAAVLTPEPWWPRHTEQWVARRLRRFAHVTADALTYGWLLTGIEVARGPDHEPLIADVRPLARMTERVVQQARWVY